MAESTPTVNRWTPTRKAALILELLRGADTVGAGLAVDSTGNASPQSLDRPPLFFWQ